MSRVSRVLSAVLSILAVIVLIGCGPAPAGDKGTEIIGAEAALKLIAGGSAVLVDANNGVTYKKRHA